jgi:hypothetical protein
MYFLNHPIDFKNGGNKIRIDHVVNVLGWIGVCLYFEGLGCSKVVQIVTSF